MNWLGWILAAFAVLSPFAAVTAALIAARMTLRGTPEPQWSMTVGDLRDARLAGPIMTRIIAGLFPPGDYDNTWQPPPGSRQARTIERLAWLGSRRRRMDAEEDSREPWQYPGQ